MAGKIPTRKIDWKNKEVVGEPPPTPVKKPHRQAIDRRAPRKNTADWRTIKDDREKYAAYLCSREWSELKKAVHERSGGTCERCLILPANQVHHLTYIRKYSEELGDLQHVCKFCHDFVHAFSDFDPASAKCWLDRIPLVKVFLSEPKYSEGLMKLMTDGERRGFQDDEIRVVIEKYQDAAVQSIDF